MTDQEILEHAISKAIDGGWSDHRGLEAIEFVKATNFTVTLKGWVEFVDEGHTDESQTEIEYYFSEIIFNHDFAKALFGEKTTNGGTIKYFPTDYLTHEVIRFQPVLEAATNRPAWQYHLQQMVIADDPIKYLGDNLPE